jgi:hypothetical protein
MNEPPGSAKRIKEEQEARKSFYKSLYVDIGLNATTVAPKKKHPRTEFAVGGATSSYDRISIHYGKNPNDISRTCIKYQDGSLFKKPFQAMLVQFPMPEPEERFLWIDLTYAVRGVYVPLAFDLPRPHEAHTLFVRLDFRHRLVRMPFARSYRPALHSAPERDLLTVPVEKAGLEIMPERAVIDDRLHPVLQGTTRFTKKILGEKAANSDNEPSKEELFKDASTNQETKKSKEELRKWLDASKGKGLKEELEKAKALDAVAKKHQIDRNPKYYRAEIDHANLDEHATSSQKFQEVLQSWLRESHEQNKAELDQAGVTSAHRDEVAQSISARIATKTPFKEATPSSLVKQSPSEREEFVKKLVKEVSDEYDKALAPTKNSKKADNIAQKQTKAFEQWVHPAWRADKALPEFKEGAYNTRRTLLSTPGGQPDCVISGHVDFKTSPKLGLGMDNPDITIRLDLRELICCLVLPDTIIRTNREKDVGYQNVSADGKAGVPIDLYSRNLVVAFPCTDLKVTKKTEVVRIEGNNDAMMITQFGINYPQLVASEHGLLMQYSPPELPREIALAQCLVQIAAVLAESIPIIGPAVSFTVYTVGNTVIDSQWIAQYENFAPPIFATIYSQKGNIKKYITQRNFKLKLKLK